MHTFRAWFTPGSIVAAMIVTLLWLHRISMSSTIHEAIQIIIVCLTFLGLWILTRDRLPGG
jgi:protein-S-isoprenylcysteine O-methyltransferase Ste14